MLEAALLGSAKKHKLSSQGRAGLFVEEHSRLEFDSMNFSADELWDRGSNTFTIACRIQSNKVMKTRFIAEELIYKHNLKPLIA